MHDVPPNTDAEREIQNMHAMPIEVEGDKGMARRVL
jgi:hypothetical protein